MAGISTLGELRQSNYRTRPVKQEIRDNLVRKLQDGEHLFPGIIGYDETVVPQLVNAILSRHNFILLGLRGQAKSRILRALVELLDDQVAIVPGCEIHDNPLDPICAALIGSMSPTMSAIVTSGVASFSTKRESRRSQPIGMSSPSFATRARQAPQIGSRGLS